MQSKVDAYGCLLGYVYAYHLGIGRSGVVLEDSLRNQDADGECSVASLGALDVELVVLCLAEHHYAYMVKGSEW